MCHEAVQEVLDRALSEPQSRRHLWLGPDHAIVGLDLSEDEATAIRTIKLEDDGQASGEVDRRRSKRPAWLCRPS